MDLDSRLANLSLGEIASMLSPKQQEVLLAAISVAANFIQQIQAEEQLQAEKRLQAAVEQQQQQQQQQQQHQQHQLHPHDLHQTTTNTTATSFNELDDDDDFDDDDDDDDQFQESLDSSSTSTYREHHSRSSSIQHAHQNHHHNHQQQHRKQHSAFDEDNIQADEKDLLTIRQFADELKHRRKAIRLSQKGAAQSLRAFTGGEQPCTDAIIYHFENLQLEPERAMQLIPLLRDWLEWAEKHRLNGKQLPMMSAVTKVPRERKRKVVLFNEKAKQFLEDAFLKNNHPDRYQLDVISQELNIPTRSIRKWFTNRRQRKRFAEKFSPVSI